MVQMQNYIKNVIALFALIVSSCTFLPEMDRVVDEVRTHKGAITSMEFSESGEELVLVSSNAAYICHVDSTAPDTRVSLCERLTLRNGMPTTAPSGGKSITALLQRMKTRRKEAPDLWGPTVFSLDGRTKLLRRLRGSVSEPSFLCCEVQRDGSVLRTLRDSDYNGIENIDQVDQDYYYAYLSPTGRYGYFVFPSVRRYAWDYTSIRAIPCPQWTVYKSFHVLADLESGQILDKQTSGRNKRSIESGNVQHTPTKAKIYESDFLASRTIVAIHERRGLIAVFDRARGALSIRTIPGTRSAQ